MVLHWVISSLADLIVGTALSRSGQPSHLDISAPLRASCYGNSSSSGEMFPYQEGTEHEEADKIGNGKIATTGKFLSWAKVRLRVTSISRKASKHYLLPCLTSGTPGEGHTGMAFWKSSKVMSNTVVGGLGE